MLTSKILEDGERFTTSVEMALKETGTPESQWSGYIFGWWYGQLRQRWTKEEARAIIEEGVRRAEEALGKLKVAGDENKN